MDQSELVKLIKKGESKSVEFKETFDNKTIETAVAFANARGGHIFVGVSDKGAKKGVQIGKETLLFGGYSGTSFRRISERLPCRIQERYLHGGIFTQTWIE